MVGCLVRGTQCLPPVNPTNTRGLRTLFCGLPLHSRASRPSEVVLGSIPCMLDICIIKWAGLQETQLSKQLRERPFGLPTMTEEGGPPAMEAEPSAPNGNIESTTTQAPVADHQAGEGSAPAEPAAAPSATDAGGQKAEPQPQQSGQPQGETTQQAGAGGEAQPASEAAAPAAAAQPGGDAAATSTTDAAAPAASGAAAAPPASAPAAPSPSAPPAASPAAAGPVQAASGYDPAAHAAAASYYAAAAAAAAYSYPYYSGESLRTLPALSASPPRWYADTPHTCVAVYAASTAPRLSVFTPQSTRPGAAA